MLYQLSYTPVSLSVFILTTLLQYTGKNPFCKEFFQKFLKIFFDFVFFQFFRLFLESEPINKTQFEF